MNDRSNARKEQRKKRYQRQMARQQKGSKRYQRTRLNVARIQRYRANCIKNMAHQVSHHLVADSTTMVVALEDLSLKNMTASAKGTVDQPGKQVRQKAGLNRSILQSGWGQLRQYLLYKTFQRGKLLVFVPPHNTSQECSRCGTIDKASRRHQSGFACTACGFTDNADRNAARVIARHAAYGLIRNKQPGQELSTVTLRPIPY
ncbi:transposase [Advenella sp. WQ 585]|uniref:Transposase n=1 Tax=Advenella mandrilli TaxID=2800330 RepID=A0ABS1EG26_9BURK|nr:RNA-guided endonuclease TnpB family protein [Advenella mandrilli]MBK1781255.1 transposase [Advenella mandrilli]